MKDNFDFAVIIPLANEEKEFEEFTGYLSDTLGKIGSGVAYLVVDNASKDKTLSLCQELSMRDTRFKTVWAPENKNVVDAYLRGYSEALKSNHEFYIEMDGGLSHDPSALPMFLRTLNEGNECAFGSRFMNGGSIWMSSWKRTVLSRGGTFLANVLLGTRMRDMTSGYQGFHAPIVKQFLNYPLRSKAHFYQTELRYLLRKKRYIEVPIHYRAPSPSVSKRAIENSISTLLYYFLLRLKRQAATLN